jgi:hypothetical protein
MERAMRNRTGIRPGVVVLGFVNTGRSWHCGCDSNGMTINPSPAIAGPLPPTGSAPQAPEVFHSLQDLPVAVGQVSQGPLGAVARQDHHSWKNKGATDPAYWSGRIDSALGDWMKDRPLAKIASCVGIGAVAGMILSCRGHRLP